MRIFSYTIFLFLLGYAWGQKKEPIRSNSAYKIEIQTSAICEMCKEAIEYDLTFAKGVKDVNLDLETKVVTVSYNPKKTDADALRRRITLVGYHADDFVRDSAAYENLPFCCKDGAHADEHEDH